MLTGIISQLLQLTALIFYCYGRLVLQFHAFTVVL